MIIQMSYHYSLDVSLQLLAAAHGPVVAVEGCLHQRSHDAAHGGLVSTAVALAVVLHAQPAQRAQQAQTSSRGEKNSSSDEIHILSSPDSPALRVPG